MKSTLKNEKDIFKPLEKLMEFNLRNSTSNEKKLKEIEEKQQTELKVQKLSEKLIIDAWESFIKSKKQFLNEEDTIRNVYENNTSTRNGLELYGYLITANLLNSILRIKEFYVDYIDFDKLKTDKTIQSIEKRIGLNKLKIERKSFFIMIRNAIGHTRYKIKNDNKDGKSKFVFSIKTNNAKSKTIEISFKDMVDYLKIIYEQKDNKLIKVLIDKVQKERIDKFTEKYYNLRREEFLQQKIDITEKIAYRVRKQNKEVYDEVNKELNNLILNNPDKTKKEIMKELFEFINKNYSVVTRENGEKKKKIYPEKSFAWFFAQSPEKIISFDTALYAQYFFTTNEYKTYHEKILNHKRKSDKMSEKLKNFLDKKVDVNDFIYRKYPNKIFGEEDKYTEVLDAFRNAFVHNRFEIDSNGNIDICTYTETAIQKTKKRKTELESLNFKTKDYKEKLYETEKRNKITSEENFLFATFTSDEIIELCNLICNEKSQKRIEAEERAKLPVKEIKKSSGKKEEKVSVKKDDVQIVGETEETKVEENKKEAKKKKENTNKKHSSYNRRQSTREAQELIDEYEDEEYDIQ